MRGRQLSVPESARRAEVFKLDRRGPAGAGCERWLERPRLRLGPIQRRLAAAEVVEGEGEEAGEMEGWIDVVLDDVESEVIEAAEAPDG